MTHLLLTAVCFTVFHVVLGSGLGRKDFESKLLENLTTDNIDKNDSKRCISWNIDSALNKLYKKFQKRSLKSAHVYRWSRNKEDSYRDKHSNYNFKNETFFDYNNQSENNFVLNFQQLFTKFFPVYRFISSNQQLQNKTGKNYNKKKKDNNNYVDNKLTDIVSTRAGFVRGVLLQVDVTIQQHFQTFLNSFQEQQQEKTFSAYNRLNQQTKAMHSSKSLEQFKNYHSDEINNTVKYENYEGNKKHLYPPPPQNLQVQAFLGIQYASTSGAQLRFMPPTGPTESWSGVKVCVAFLSYFVEVIDHQNFLFICSKEPQINEDNFQW